jgi:ribosomal protein L11 methyltransferase
MIHYEYIFEKINPEVSDLLIAELSEIGFDGFEEQDSTLMAYIKEADFDSDLFNNLIDKYAVKCSKSIIKEKNWNEVWESDFEPILVSSKKDGSIFAFVRAHFHPVNNEALYDLLITPKMSFGTGHHATTFQMMEEMSTVDFNNKQVVDFGTGTGLLAILAEKMGAREVIAIDNDDWSINNAKENIAANSCSAIKLVKSDYCSAEINYADIVLANINLNVIKANLNHIRDCSKSNALVIFSGILVDDEEEIMLALQHSNFEIINKFQKTNWLLISTRLVSDNK